MNIHLEETLVEVILPLVDESGNFVTPTELTAVLIDGEGRQLMDFGPIAFSEDDKEVKIVIPRACNRLLTEELREVRRLDLTITYDGSVLRKSKVYGIEAEQSLQIMRNSFMTYETAVLNALGFVNMTTFNGDTDERRKAALVEAFRRICELPMIYALLDAEGRAVSEYRISAATWPQITEDAFQAQFPSHFKRALRSAQIAEADELLQGNVVARKHAQGIASETIGESSVAFREGFGGVGTGISSAAQALLAGYIDKTVRLVRG